MECNYSVRQPKLGDVDWGESEATPKEGTTTTSFQRGLAISASFETMKAVTSHRQRVWRLCCVNEEAIICVSCASPVSRRKVEIVTPEGRLLTDDQLTDVLPVQLASLLMDESHCDSPLNSLPHRWQKLSVREDTARAKLNPPLKKKKDIWKQWGGLWWSPVPGAGGRCHGRAVLHCDPL